MPLSRKTLDAIKAPVHRTHLSMVATPLKWHGGKGYLAPKIVSLFPKHTAYVEPYFGGGAVLLASDPEERSEVVNDLNGALANFWRALQSPLAFPEMLRILEAMPFSEQEWRRSKKYLAEMEAARAFLEKDQPSPFYAAYFFVACRQSLAGRMRSFAPMSRSRVRRGMNEQASAWITAVDGLEEVHRRLRRVVILGPRPAPDIIRQEDGPNTLYYLDPPYLLETRAAGAGEYGQYEMGHNDHLDLLQVLREVKGKFILSGYRSSLYDDFATKQGWRRVDFSLPNNAASGSEKRRMTESCWMNY